MNHDRGKIEEPAGLPLGYVSYCWFSLRVYGQTGFAFSGTMFWSSSCLLGCRK